MSTTPLDNHTLAGVYLPANTRWLDRRQRSGVAQQVLYSLSGHVHVYTQPILEGQRITLSVELPYAVMYTDKYDELSALEVPGAVFSFVWVDVDDLLVHTDNVYSVMFDYSQGPALDFTHIDTVGGVPEDRIDRGRYQGRIHLITV